MIAPRCMGRPPKQRYVFTLAMLWWLAQMSLIQFLPVIAVAQPEDDDHSRMAIDFWLVSAYSGSAKAQYRVGVMYAEGLGVDQDPEEAVYWYRQSAKQNFAAAQYNLGDAYLRGFGVAQDFEQAIVWWRRAAQQGLVQAQTNLGRAYFLGVGTNKNAAKARHWLSKAVAAGDPLATEMLAKLGGPRDVVDDGPVWVFDRYVRAEGAAGKIVGVGVRARSKPDLGRNSTIVGYMRNGEPVTVIERQGDWVLVSTAPDANAGALDEIYVGPILEPIQAEVAVLEGSGAEIAGVDTGPAEEPVQIQFVAVESTSEAEPAPAVEAVENPDYGSMWVFGHYVETDGDKAQITGVGVHARSQPGAGPDSRILRYMQDGESVTILRRQGDWVLIRVVPDIGVATVVSSPDSAIEQPPEAEVKAKLDTSVFHDTDPYSRKVRPLAAAAYDEMWVAELGTTPPREDGASPRLPVDDTEDRGWKIVKPTEAVTAESSGGFEVETTDIAKTIESEATIAAPLEDPVAEVTGQPEAGEPTDSVQAQPMVTTLASPVGSQTPPAEQTGFQRANDHAWLYGNSPGRFTIQLISTTREDLANRFIDKLKLAQGRYFVSRNNEQDWYYVLTGSYPTESEASSAANALPVKSTWVRQFGELQRTRCEGAHQLPAPLKRELGSICADNQLAAVDQTTATGADVTSPPAVIEPSMANGDFLLLNDNGWLYRQDRNQYTIQLISVRSQPEALAFVRGRKLDRARIFSTHSKGVRWYYVLLGNYPDRAQARKVSADLPVESVWLRRLGSLQDARCRALSELPADEASQLQPFCG